MHPINTTIQTTPPATPEKRPAAPQNSPSKLMETLSLNDTETAALLDLRKRLKVRSRSPEKDTRNTLARVDLQTP